jgi:hypothetical protein
MFARSLITRQRTLDCLDQHILGDRLQQKVFGTGLYRSDTRRDISMPGQEHDRQWIPRLGETRLQLGPAQAGHPHIEQYAPGLVARRRFQQTSGRLVEGDLIPGRA